MSLVSACAALGMAEEGKSLQGAIQARRRALAAFRAASLLMAPGEIQRLWDEDALTVEQALWAWDWRRRAGLLP